MASLDSFPCSRERLRLPRPFPFPLYGDSASSGSPSSRLLGQLRALLRPPRPAHVQVYLVDRDRGRHVEVSNRALIAAAPLLVPSRVLRDRPRRSLRDSAAVPRAHACAGRAVVDARLAWDPWMY